MSDYISREAAIKAAEHAYGEWNLAMAAADGARQINLVYKRQELLKAVASVFDIVPAADVEPVRLTIDRAIEILDPEHREQYESIDPVNEACRMGMEALERTRWISCSERPPEELEPVNVVWVNHNPMPYYRYMKDVPQKATAVYYRGAWYWWSCVCEDLLVECGANETDRVDDDVEITHWQPLPELPKEENDETIDG